MGVFMSRLRAFASVSPQDDVAAVKECIKGFWGQADLRKEERDKYALDDCMLIRPTGNPMTMALMDGMLDSTDISVELQEVTEFHHVDVSGDRAFTCFSQHAKFSFKGTPNDDLAVFTAYLHRTPAGWRVAYAQRSSGRAPTDDKPSF